MTDLIQIQKNGQAIDCDDLIIQERDKEIKVIHSEMQEINTIFKTLAEIVNEQGKLVDNVHDNIQLAVSDVIDGKTELEKAAKSQKKSSKLSLWIAGIVTSAVMIGSAIVVGVILI